MILVKTNLVLKNRSFATTVNSQNIDVEYSVPLLNVAGSVDILH